MPVSERLKGPLVCRDRVLGLLRQLREGAVLSLVEGQVIKKSWFRNSAEIAHFCVLERGCFAHNASTVVQMVLPDGNVIQMHYCASRIHSDRLVLELVREIDLQTLRVVRGIDVGIEACFICSFSSSGFLLTF